MSESTPTSPPNPAGSKSYETLTPVQHVPWDGTGAAPHAPGKVVWSTVAGHAEPPCIGTRVKVTMNGLGWGSVARYWIADGFLGLVVELEKPPRWFSPTQAKGTPARVSGAEIGEARKPKWLATWQSRVTPGVRLTTGGASYEEAVSRAMPAEWVMLGAEVVKPKIYRVRYESGIGEGSYTRTWKSLASAAKYVIERWEGVEYMNSRDRFHNDYGHFVCKGFNLHDLGTPVFDGVHNGARPVGWKWHPQFRTIALADQAKRETPAIVGGVPAPAPVVARADAIKSTADGIEAMQFQPDAEPITYADALELAAAEPALTPEQLEAAREWVADCTWADLDEQSIADLSPGELTRAVAKHFDGGLAAFLETFDGGAA